MPMHVIPLISLRIKLVTRSVYVTALLFILHGSVSAQINYSYPGMQALTTPIPLVSGNNYPKANDTAVTANQVYINDYNNSTNLFDSTFIKNIVTFRINEAIPRTLAKPFSATLTYKVYFTGKSGKIYDSVHSNLTLAISFDTTKAAVYNTSNSLVFYNGYQVKVKIISLTLTDTSLLKALEVDNTIVFHNYYKFNCATSAVTTLGNTGPVAGSGIPDELPVTWTGIPGVSGYDLEWTYIDSSAITSNKYGVQNTPAFYTAAFQNNATRVNLTDTFSRYYIPLLFEKQGILYARIRSFQNVPNGRRMESNWGSYTYYGFSGHQTNLNWQSSTSFAEEGKRKSVVQYFDGSLRNRQTVTKDNTTRTTIVAEKFYDNQGREAIQVLPAPTVNTIIQYTPDFNNINSAEYDKTHYDKLIAGYVCGSGADSMKSTTTGASTYYSPSNPNKTVGFNQFIPDAKYYPYSETRYLPDNTGRIALQGGVGKMHQIGNGHETRYYYGNPDQTELDGLFGTEVGIASHYFKNMVRDANGQYSVSYIDMHGRTIATALAGNLADSIKLDYLGNKKDSILTKTITDSTNNIVKGLYMESSKTIQITKSDTVTFNYTLPANTLVINDCTNTPVNYNCLYDLLVTITDHCNNQTFGGSPYTYSQTNIPSQSLVSFNVQLPEGEYVVTKTLTIDEASLEYYRDSVFMKRNLCNTLNIYTTNYIDSFKVLHNNCAVATCTSCLAALGTYTTFRSNLITQNGWNPGAISPSMEASMAAEYAKQTTDCNALCPRDTNEIDMITSQMLTDMTPGGQYADSTNIDQWSIFYPASGTLLYMSSYIQYLDANGNPDTVIINGYPLIPNLLTQKDFVNNFKPSWANALLPYHPEYQRLKYLTDSVSRSSFTWDNDFSNTTTFSAAYAKGYLNPTGNAAFVNKFTDISLPYLSSPPIRDSLFIRNATALSTMNSKMNLFSISPGVDTISIWGSASAMGYCISDTNRACVTFNKKTPFSDTSSCIGSANTSWKFFASQYESAKEQIIQNLITTNRPVSTALNTAFSNGTHTSRFTFDPTSILNSAYAGVSVGSNTTSGINANGAAVNSLLAGQYQSNCTSYATVWWSQLTPCTTAKLYPDSAAIVTNLIAVCEKGSNATHPNGSSSISPDSTNTYNSFDDVINFYVNKYNGSHTDQISQQACNGELILYPQAYSSPQSLVDNVVYNRPDSADCAQIARLYSSYQTSPGTFTSFSNYLLLTTNTIIPDSTLNVLLGGCSIINVQCNYLTTPVTLPRALQIGAGSTCVYCQTFRNLKYQFDTEYPNIVPVADTLALDTTQVAKNALFDHFMNSRLGFSKTTTDYLTFFNSCTAMFGSQQTYDSLETILSGFKDTAINCTLSFTTWFNLKRGTSYTYNQIDSIYFAICGFHASFACTGVLNTADTCTNFRFQKDYSGSGIDIFNDVHQTTDGGYIMAGTTTSFGYGGVDAYLVKTDKRGNVVWAKTYGGSNNDNFRRVKQTSDGGFIAVGTTASFHQSQGEIFVVKTNANGDQSWSLGLNQGTAYGEDGYDIIQTYDSGYAVAGLYNFSPGVDDWEVVKLNKLGSVSWAKRFGSTSSDNLGSIIEDNDTLVVGGLTYSTAIGGTTNFSYYDAVIFKVNESNGNLIWTKSYDLEDESNFTLSLSATHNGYRANILDATDWLNDNASNVILDVDRNGIFRWAKKLPVPSGATISNGAGNLTSDNGTIYAQGESNVNENIYVQKIDSLGNITWTNRIQRTGNQMLNQIIQNQDGTFTGVGYDGNSGFMVKTDKLGTTSCFDAPYSYTSTVVSDSVWTDAMPINATLTFGTVVINAPGLTAFPTKTIVCSSDCSPPSLGPILCPDTISMLPQIQPAVASVCSDSTTWSASRATNVFKIYSDSLKGSFWSAYIGKCLQIVKTESLTMSQKISEYQYTLYYYDQAGNLIKTVPPAGVVRSYNPTWISQVRTARANGTALLPAHTLVTNYRYNTLNLAMAQQTPDAGISDFWYDRLGRLVLSQNAKQLAEGTNYSYTLYDAIGRITEVGQINTGVGAVTTNTTKVPASWAAWLASNATNRYQITNTVYDVAGPGIISPWLIQNPSTLRNRVSYSTITPGQKGSTPVYGTYYNYDIAGNVSSLLQDYGASSVMGTSGQEYKRVDYNFDLISGKVNSVGYQLGKPDAFMHYYQYDAENRLTDVYSSADSVTVEHEAHYTYYAHGPLARALIGANQVQGIDYAYTLQGWLKSVNSTTLNPVNDMGQDGNIANQAQQYIGQDAYGYSLQYFEGDYNPIIGGSFLSGAKTALGTAYKGLYNGNISSMAVNIGVLNNPKLYNYEYDQLNRITGMVTFNGTNTGLNLWSGTLPSTTDYQETASYDPNGNIQTYVRNGYSGVNTQMDNLTYHYNAGTNKLNYIVDAVASGNYPNDLDNQSTNNYTYDAAGNLLTDQLAGVTANMTWSVYGKLLTVSSKSLSYQYDAAGNRIGKTSGSTSTWYVRDAQGNVLSVYTGTGMPLSEQHLYGSSRLGMINGASTIAGTSQFLDNLGSGTIYTFARGKKLFELSNHLGNVLVTISDKKYGTPVSGVPSQVSYYTADVKSAQDYYPFGMQMPGRVYTTTSSYRFGFNGQENSSEISGSGNHTTAEFWEYDPRIGRRWNLDPKPNVGISQYSVFNNTPTWFGDPFGDTSVNGAGGKQQVDIDEKQNSLNFYKSNTDYAISGTNTKVPIISGQLRSFTNPFGTFSARWKVDPSGNAVFTGYFNDKNQTLEAAVSEITSSWAFKLMQFGNYMSTGQSKDPIGFNLKLTTSLLSMSAMAAVEPVGYPSGYNPSVTLSEGGAEYGFAYRAINPKFVQSTIESGFYISGAAGRLGNDGLYVNSTIEGAIKEFQFHNPGLSPSIFEVRYPWSRPLLINPPSGYFSQSLPFTQGGNILSAPSLRAPGTTNLLIRSGAEVGTKIQ
jgi:hypothetical protein